MPGDRFDLKQSKASKYRATTVNPTVVRDIDDWLEIYRPSSPDAPLFPSRTTGEALKVQSAIKMVKTWCSDVGLRGQFGSHSLWKTWGYHQRVTFGQPVALLMRAFGHSSEAQKRLRICVFNRERMVHYTLKSCSQSQKGEETMSSDTSQPESIPCAEQSKFTNPSPGMQRFELRPIGIGLQGNFQIDFVKGDRTAKMPWRVQNLFGGTTSANFDVEFRFQDGSVKRRKFELGVINRNYDERGVEVYDNLSSSPMTSVEICQV